MGTAHIIIGNLTLNHRHVQVSLLDAEGGLWCGCGAFVQVPSMSMKHSHRYVVGTFVAFERPTQTLAHSSMKKLHGVKSIIEQKSFPVNVRTFFQCLVHRLCSITDGVPALVLGQAHLLRIRNAVALETRIDQRRPMPRRS